jgi:3-phosphoshikimate 1-carboxyvinyltransferase
MPADLVEIEPLGGPLRAEVPVPGSKSMTNRALILAALADGPTAIEHALRSDDTDRMVGALGALGFALGTDEAAATMTVVGQGGRIPSRKANLFVGASGTCARFLTALVALGSGEYALDGGPRMRQRPIAPLLEALNQLGAEAVSVPGTGCLPVRVRARGLRGGRAAIDASVSSQFVSALLMVAPRAEDGLELRLEGAVVSRPYIDMTLQQMARAGVEGRWRDDRTLVVPGGQRYRAGRQVMESDASNASYFFAAAAATGGWVRVSRLPSDSIQGDLALLGVLEAMGCRVRREADAVEVSGPEGGRLRAVAVDANAFPDMAQTIAALAPFADGPVEVRNVASLRVKETDRIGAVVAELRRLGQEVEERPDRFRITPRPLRPATVRTYDDHRMAMAFSIVGLRAPGVRIADPGCVAKTFPTYFDALAGAGVGIRYLEPAVGKTPIPRSAG